MKVAEVEEEEKRRKDILSAKQVNTSAYLTALVYMYVLYIMYDP